MCSMVPEVNFGSRWAEFLSKSVPGWIEQNWEAGGQTDVRMGDSSGQVVCTASGSSMSE